jgi:hypothetical protein
VLLNSRLRIIQETSREAGDAMAGTSSRIKKFFEDFERGSNTFESDLIASQFSDTFMVADPHGGVQVVTKGAFVAGIAQRRQFFQTMGFKFVKVLALEETPLDDKYVLAKIKAQMRFEREPGRPVDLVSNSTYILFIGADSPTVVFYLTHEDMIATMREQVLLS